MVEAICRTSDRVAFGECRLRWSITSHLRENRSSISVNGAYWFGSGIHYALEDKYGDKRFVNAQDAFQAYVDATLIAGTAPEHYAEDSVLALGMLRYYEDVWLEIEIDGAKRNELETFVFNGVPQIEQKFRIKIEVPNKIYPDVYYEGIFDRVIVDEIGRLWVLDYKTTQRFTKSDIYMNQQALTYYWAAKHLYPEKKVAGVVWWQFAKRDPFDKDTRKQKINPTKDEDEYIKREWIPMKDINANNEYKNMCLQVRDMLNPNTSIYPSYGTHCRWCSFRTSCQIKLDKDDEAFRESFLSISTESQAYFESWRAFLQFPKIS